MEAARAKLLHRGRLLIEGVCVNLQPRPACKVPGSKRISWAGDLLIPQGKCVQAGEPYELVLRDGRRGQILFRRSATAYDVPVAARFVGSGPLEVLGAGEGLMNLELFEGSAQQRCSPHSLSSGESWPIAEQRAENDPAGVAWRGLRGV
jgi:hypothetical protein